ncbi:hypothetical protein ACXJJ3_12860 [Kribbella sp. WER1]
MVIAISGLLLFGALFVLMVARLGLKASHGVIAFLFGYFVAKSQYSPMVQDLLNKIAGH